MKATLMRRAAAEDLSERAVKAALIRRAASEYLNGRAGNAGGAEVPAPKDRLSTGAAKVYQCAKAIGYMRNTE
jgi:hypothetical protein